MRHTLYLSILVLSLVTACTKEADMNIAKESEHTVKKNLFRVTRIEGHNDHWGDYIWIINYNKEQIESAFHIDTEGDTIGNFGISNNSDINYEIEVNDWIPKIDSDSISRLDQFLKNKYGAGNYSLKDSIPLVGRVLYSQKVDLYEDGRIKRQSVVHYTPREDVGTGEDFDNSYLKTYRTINTYEYNENSNICINRIYHDVYDPEDIHQETYERTLHKYETLYEGDRITSILYMTAPAGENWIEQDRYSFTYSGNLLQSVKSNGRTLEFTYNGTVPATVTDGETQYTYLSLIHI